MRDEASVKIEDEGEVSAESGYRRKTDREIKQLALDLVEGRAFVSWQLTEWEKHLLPMVFMGLTFLNDVQLKELERDKIEHFYGHYVDALPRSINGLPMFGKFGMLTMEDAVRVNDAAKKLIEARKRFVESEEG